MHFMSNKENLKFFLFQIQCSVNTILSSLCSSKKIIRALVSFFLSLLLSNKSRQFVGRARLTQTARAHLREYTRRSHCPAVPGFQVIDVSVLMKFRERKKSTRGRIELTNARLLAYRPYAQPVTLVSRRKELKGAAAHRRTRSWVGDA